VKKIRIVQIVGILLFLVYVSFIIINSFKISIIRGKETFIFSILLAVLSITLIYKGVLLKSSSTLWFALNLISYAIILLLFDIFDIKLNENYYILSLIPIIASIINLAVFGYLIYIKVIILNISIIIPVMLWQFIDINIWWLLAIALFSVLLGIIICRSIYFKREKF